MAKYSDAEVETAKNLLKRGFKWIARDSELFNSDVYVYAEKPHKELYSELHSGKTNVDVWIWRQPSDASDCTYVCSGFASIFQNIKFGDSEPTSLEDIVYPQILDEEEKQYLSAVVKPFRNDVIGIRKSNFTDLHDPEKHMYQRISIILTGANEDVVLPLFENGTKYKGMESFHSHTLEELGL